MGAVFFIVFVILIAAVAILSFTQPRKDQKRIISKNDLRVIIITILICLVFFGIIVFF
jgi:uncharacterized membrane protein YidH (DUF202 family)